MSTPPDLLVARALAAYHARRWTDAEAVCRELVAQHPNNREGRFLLQVLANSGSSQAHIGLAFALWKARRFVEGLSAFHAAVDIAPNDPMTHHNYAVALNDLKQFDKAIHHFRKAIELKPDYPDPHLGLAQIHLVHGDMEKGWIEYEWRRRLPGALKGPPELQWRGEQLAGRTIVLLDEQGFGDTIQFVRYAPLVAEQGAKVIVVCNPALVELLTMVPGVDRIEPRGQRVKGYDFHWPLISLPLIFRTRLDTIPARVPYLRVPPARLEQWKQELGPAAGLRVGLVWAGNPGHRSDRDRSLAPLQLAPLARLPDNAKVTFYNLQKGTVSAHAAGMPPLPLIDLQQQNRNLADAAALIANLDLVITVDTAVAHLAGALGRPVWVLLQFGSDWRWLRDREDSPWYPTMRLFRQETLGNWQPVIERVTRELAALVQYGTIY